MSKIFNYLYNHFFLPKIENKNIICLNKNIMEKDELLKQFESYQQIIKNEIALEINNTEHILFSSDSSSNQIIDSFQNDLVLKKIFFENHYETDCEILDKAIMKMITFHCNCFVGNTEQSRLMANIYNFIEIMETNQMDKEKEYIISFLNSVQIKNKTNYKFFMVSINQKNSNKYIIKLFGVKFLI